MGRRGQRNGSTRGPLNEAYIDYVKGHPHAGIIADLASPLTEAAIVQKNQADDEADVSTGYHALEFLLWGQDLSLDRSRFPSCLGLHRRPSHNSTPPRLSADCH